MMVAIGLVLLMIAVNNEYQMNQFIGGWDRYGVEKRWKLMVVAMEMVKTNPLLGVGMGNFVYRLADYDRGLGGQPVHNLELLILVETGWLTILVVGFWILKLTERRWKNWRGWLWAIWLTILVTGMVDHYWLTLPQNRWLLALLVATALSRVKLKNV